MSDDLNARLRAASDAYTARESSTRPDDLELAAVHRDVRRRRLAHHARVGGVAAGVVAVVTTAGWLGVTRPQPPVPPAATATPTPGASTTPTATPTPRPTPAQAATRTPADEPGLPPMWRLDAATIASVGPGWSLVTYTSVLGTPAAPARLVLASPTGELFLAGKAPADALTRLVAWDGGSKAVVEVGQLRATFDLYLGKAAPDARGLPPGLRAQDAAAGVELWQGDDGAAWVVPPSGDARRVPGTRDLRDLSPRGTHALATGDDAQPLVVDLATGDARDLGVDGLTCDPVGWADDTHVALTCTDPTDADGGGYLPYLLSDPTSRPRLVVVAADGTGQPQVRTIARGELVPGRVLPVRSGTVVIAGAPLGDGVLDCMTDSELRTGDDVAVVPGAAPDAGTVVTDVHGDVLHAWRSTRCAPDGPSELLRVDTATGAVSVLPPGPDAAWSPSSAVTLTR